MILCVTPNPAIDRTLRVNSLQVGELQRAEQTLVAAGGKGLNVARTIRSLGGSPVCAGLIGGHAGNLLAELAEREGFSAHWTRIKSETRTCIILIQPGTDATVVNEPGAEVDVHECLSFLHDVWEAAQRAHLVCVSGSLPPGFSTESFRTLLGGLVEQKKSVWVDTSGQALKAALGVRGVNLKINAAELGEALGEKIVGVQHALRAAKVASKMLDGRVAVTIGAAGAVLADETGAWLAQPPRLGVVSSVGSGDAFLGGLALALDVRNPTEVALRHAVAAGAANSLHFGGGMILQSEFDEICEITKLSSITPESGNLLFD